MSAIRNSAPEPSIGRDVDQYRSKSPYEPTIWRNFNLKKTVYNIPVKVPTSLNILDNDHLFNSTGADLSTQDCSFNIDSTQRTIQKQSYKTIGYEDDKEESIESLINQISLTPAPSSVPSFSTKFEFNSRGVPLPLVPNQSNDSQVSLSGKEFIECTPESSPSMHSEHSFCGSTSCSSYTGSDMTRHSTNASLSSFSSVSTGKHSPLLEKDLTRLPWLTKTPEPKFIHKERTLCCDNDVPALDPEAMLFSVSASSINPYNNNAELAAWMADQTFPRYVLHTEELTPKLPFFYTQSPPIDPFFLQLNNSCSSPAPTLPMVCIITKRKKRKKKLSCARDCLSF